MVAEWSPASSQSDWFRIPIETAWNMFASCLASAVSPASPSWAGLPPYPPSVIRWRGCIYAWAYPFAKFAFSNNCKRQQKEQQHEQQQDDDDDDDLLVFHWFMTLVKQFGKSQISSPERGGRGERAALITPYASSGQPAAPLPGATLSCKSG